MRFGVSSVVAAGLFVLTLLAAVGLRAEVTVVAVSAAVLLVVALVRARGIVPAWPATSSSARPSRATRNSS